MNRKGVLDRDWSQGVFSIMPRKRRILSPVAKVFREKGKRREKSSRAGWSPQGLISTRVAEIPGGRFIGTVSILGSGSNVDVRSSGGYNGTSRHKRVAKTTSFVPSTPTPSPASSFAGAIIKSRATSSWRRQRRAEAAVNDATWQLVKKLVTLTVPLCKSRLVKTPF